MEEPQEETKSTEIVEEKKELQEKQNLLKWMDISVTEPEKRVGTSMKMQETFTVYLIETKVTDPEVEHYGQAFSLWRRFSEFELLRNYLDIMYPAIIVPPLPEKRVSYAWHQVSTDKFDPDFIDRRRVGLEVLYFDNIEVMQNMLLRIAAHPVLCQDKILFSFLREEEGWKEAVAATDYQSKADWKIKTMSASYRIKKADRRFEEMKTYSNELQTNLTNILKLRAFDTLLTEGSHKYRDRRRVDNIIQLLTFDAKMADRLYGIHKIHSNYGRVFSEWSVAEREMGDGLQSAGHYMDVHASQIDSILEDEELFADQLKEYLAFGDSLRSVCRKQELIQLGLEKAEDNLAYKTNQKQQLMDGKQSTLSFSGMKSRLFGGDTAEQKEQKLKQLDEQIEEAEQQLQKQTQEAELFVEDALRDIERFKKQKTKDIKEAFLNYAILQIDKCKKGIAVWQSVKDCFVKI